SSSTTWKESRAACTIRTGSSGCACPRRSTGWFPAPFRSTASLRPCSRCTASRSLRTCGAMRCPDTRRRQRRRGGSAASGPPSSRLPPSLLEPACDAIESAPAPVLAPHARAHEEQDQERKPDDVVPVARFHRRRRASEVEAYRDLHPEGIPRCVVDVLDRV